MGTIFLLALNVLSGLYQTFVFMKTFNWFVSPTFDIPTIGYGLALALSLTLSLAFGLNQTLAAAHYERTRMNKADLFESGVSISLARVVLITIIFAVSFMLKVSIY